MKKYGLLMLIVMLAFIFGCSDRQEPQNGKKTPETPRHTEKPGADGQTSKGADVVDMHGMVQNLGRLDAFVNEKEGTQRLIRYTIEGDPMYYDITRKNGRIELRLDSTMDEYGSGTVQIFDCGRMNRGETETQIRYVLTGCAGEREEVELLTIHFDVSRQDRFDFVLKYGPGLKNEIHTAEQKLVKSLDDGAATVSDFAIPEKDLQKIYRALVLAGYLTEKKLSAACSGPAGDAYDLTVYINSGERKFRWNSCDGSPDGKQMTAVAEEIIGIVHSGSVYRSLPKTAAEQGTGN